MSAQQQTATTLDLTEERALIPRRATGRADALVAYNLRHFAKRAHDSGYA